MTTGAVTAPFSFEVFLSLNDEAVICLLKYYADYKRGNFDYENLLGGGEQVGWQLRNASSRDPSRFLQLLVIHWTDIPGNFADDMMEGISYYLSYRHGSMQPDNSWEPIEELDGCVLAEKILDELDRHSTYWRLNPAAAVALNACAYVVKDTVNASRFIFLTIGFLSYKERNIYDRDSLEFLTVGLNMTIGKVVEALIILCDNFLKDGINFPDLLVPVLCGYAAHENPAIRALVLDGLPYIQSKKPILGWQLFYLATKKDTEGLWSFSEKCLYFSYAEDFDKVSLILEQIKADGGYKDMETWGRISALSVLSGHIDLDNFLKELSSINIASGWEGAAGVWTHAGNIKQHWEQCFTGICAGLKSNLINATAVAKYLENIFRESNPAIFIPMELIELCFNKADGPFEDKGNNLFGYGAWLNAMFERDPNYSLTAYEMYLKYIDRINGHFYDNDDEFVQLMTRLFTEAEEREESDQGEMLERVVVMQDLLLSLGGNSINAWLLAAERP